jgi:uncharacterized protein
MSAIFVDTSGWGHLVDQSQTCHKEATDLYRRARQEGSRLVTTNYILTELVALLTSPLRIPRARTIAFIASLKSSPYLDILHVDTTFDAQAWQLLADRPERSGVWSIARASSSCDRTGSSKP